MELVRQTKHLGRLPVVNFAAGGVATPADAALMMQLGMDGVFVGSGIFKSGDPSKRARAIVQVRVCAAGRRDEEVGKGSAHSSAGLFSHGAREVDRSAWSLQWCGACVAWHARRP